MVKTIFHALYILHLENGIKQEKESRYYIIYL